MTEPNPYQVTSEHSTQCDAGQAATSSTARRAWSGRHGLVVAALACAVLLVSASCGRSGAEPAATPSATSSAVTSSPTRTAVGALVWQEPVQTSTDFDASRTEFAVGPGGLVAVTTTSSEEPARTQTHTSTDGVTWTARTTIEGVRLHSVAAGGPGFVAVGSRDATAGGTTPVVATSTDGRRWDVNTLPSPNGAPLDVAATAAGLVAVGDMTDEAGAPRPAVWTSPDGTSWAAGASGQFGDARATLVNVATAGSVVIVVGRVPSESDSPGQMLGWRSSDGFTWEPTTTPADWGSVLVGDVSSGSAAVLVGTPVAGSTPRAWVTVDGHDWDSRALPTLPDTDSSFAVDVASGGDRYVAVGDDVNFAEDLGPAQGRTAIWTSSDGVSWLQVPQEDLAGPVLQARSDAARVLYRDGRWLVYGTTSAMADAPTTWVLWIGEATS